MEMGMVMGMIAQLFIPGIGAEKAAVTAAKIEKELPVLNRLLLQAEKALGNTCGTNSFVAGTLVQMADGTTREIENVKPGEWVVSRNVDTLAIEESQVLYSIEHPVQSMVALAIGYDTRIEDERLICTLDHPFYVIGKCWVNASDLVSGDVLLTANGINAIVRSTTVYSEQYAPVMVYNLTVSGNHTFFVGGTHGGVWVHNRGCDDIYSRPTHFRVGIRKKVWEAAKNEDGKVIDPVTGLEILETDVWHMGHKPGYEFKKHQISALKRKLTRKQFLDEYNDPTHYRPEFPLSNSGHSGEAPDDFDLWP